MLVGRKTNLMTVMKLGLMGLSQFFGDIKSNLMMISMLLLYYLIHVFRNTPHWKKSYYLK